MTAQMMARDAYAMISMTTYHPAPVTSDPIIARMDRAEADRNYDRDADGLRRSRYGDVGGARMMCQVAVLGSDTLFIFWSLANGHQRRLLVDGQGQIWIEVRARAMRQATKYDAVVAKIMAARAH